MISGRSYRLVVATLIYQLLNLESCQGQINGLSKDELKGAKRRLSFENLKLYVESWKNNNR